MNTHDALMESQPAWFTIALIGFAVVAAIVLFSQFLSKRGDGRTILVLGGIALGLLVVWSMIFTVREAHDVAQIQPPKPIEAPVVEKPQLTPPLIPVSGASAEEKKNSAVSDETNPKTKPAWLTETLPPHRDEILFRAFSIPCESEAKCLQDLESQLPSLIATEIERETGEAISISLTPVELKDSMKDRFIEERSDGLQILHVLVNIKPQKFAMIMSRAQQVRLLYKIELLGVSLGGAMLMFGVIYLILCRVPRVVDPTLETFSTT